MQTFWTYSIFFNRLLSKSKQHLSLHSEASTRPAFSNGLPRLSKSGFTGDAEAKHLQNIQKGYTNISVSPGRKHCRIDIPCLHSGIPIHVKRLETDKSLANFSTGAKICRESTLCQELTDYSADTNNAMEKDLFSSEFDKMDHPRLPNDVEILGESPSNDSNQSRIHLNLPRLGAWVNECRIIEGEREKAPKMRPTQSLPHLGKPTVASQHNNHLKGAKNKNGAIHFKVKQAKEKKGKQKSLTQPKKSHSRCSDYKPKCHRNMATSCSNTRISSEKTNVALTLPLQTKTRTLGTARNGVWENCKFRKK